MFPKIGIPKMDGENNRKPYEQMDDLGVPLFLETAIFTEFNHSKRKSILQQSTLLLSKKKTYR